MVKILGTPYIRGNSDVITSLPYADTVTGAGLAVVKDSDGAMALYSGTGKIYGVSGNLMKVTKWGDANVSGMRLYVQAATPAESLTIGSPVFVTSAGKFTATEGSNTATRATVASAMADCLDPVTGATVKGFAIDFEGGLY